MIARLPSFSAKAAPLWPKYLSRQPGHPICWPACRRAGCLQRAYPSHATEQDDATTEITVAGGPRVRIRLPPAASLVRTRVLFSRDRAVARKIEAARLLRISRKLVAE